MNVIKELQKAHVFFQKKDVNNALASYEKILKKYPNQPDALVNLVKIYIGSKKVELAEAPLEKLAGITKDINISQNLIILKYDLGKYEEAKKIIHNVALDNKKNYIATLYQAKIARVEKDYELAEKIYRQMLSDHPAIDLLWTNLGFLLNELERYQEAIDCYDKALEINRSSYAIYYNLGVSLLNLNEYQKAKIAFKKSIELNPNEVDPYINLSTIYFRTSNIKKSKEVIKQALKIDPQNAKTNFQLALNYSYERDFLESENYYKRALEIDKNYAKAHYSYSMSLLQQRRYEDFKTHYRWRTKDPENVKSFQNLFDDFDILEISKHEKMLFYYEQGIGDQIFFSRFLKKIKNEYKLVSSPKTMQFFKQNFEPEKIISQNEYKGEEEKYVGYKKINLGSVIRLLPGREIEETRNIIYQIKESKKQDIEKNEKIKIGLSWRSRQDQFGLSKSLSLDKLIASIRNKEEIDFINLQYGDIREDVEKIKRINKVDLIFAEELDITNEMNDLGELITKCDLVITCSNVTAHMAGILGKRTLLIAPKLYGRLWFWDADENNNSYWYPSVSMIYKDDDNWDELMPDVNSFIKNN